MGKEKLEASSKRLLMELNNAVDETKKKCSGEIDELRCFLSDILHYFTEIPRKPRFHISLVDVCIAELWRQSLWIYYLTMIGLYRNAFESIRFVLESMIQSLYIDSRHPNASMRTKIEILKEIEGKEIIVLLIFLAR